MPDPSQEWIDNYFKGKTGRFLDIGAYDGYINSLTCGLAMAGWSGVFVEPNPPQFITLLERYRHAGPRLQFVHAAIAAQAGLVKFWSADRGQGNTLNKQWRDMFMKMCGTVYDEYHVAAITPIELLNAFGGPRDWHFVSIDAEGVSIEICCALPLAEMIDTEIMCIEWAQGLEEGTAGRQELLACLTPYYHVVFSDVTNVIVKRKA